MAVLEGFVRLWEYRSKRSSDISKCALIEQFFVEELDQEVYDDLQLAKLRVLGCLLAQSYEMFEVLYEKSSIS